MSIGKFTFGQMNKKDCFAGKFGVRGLGKGQFRNIFDVVIDNIHNHRYKTNKCQASFVPPTKFVNVFVLERKYLLCPYNNKVCYDGNNLSTHYNKQRMNLESSTALESLDIKQM